jgi:hypothetical protein
MGAPRGARLSVRPKTAVAASSHAIDHQTPRSDAQMGHDVPQGIAAIDQAELCLYCGTMAPDCAPEPLSCYFGK